MIDDVQMGAGHGLDDELGDAFTPREARGLAVVIDQQHFHLAAIPRVDEAGGVEDRHPVAESQTRPGQDQSRVAGRDRDGHASRHQRPGAGSQRHGLGGAEVEAGVAVAGVGRERHGGVEPADGHADGVRQ